VSSRAATDARRIEILRAAAAAFRRHGYHGASTEAIAQTLGMRKSHLYYYFRNKEEILFVLHDWSASLLLDRLREVQESGLPTAQKLRDLTRAFVRMIIDELHGTALTLDLEPLSPGALRKVVRKRDRFERGVRALVQEGIDGGEFAPGNVKLKTFALLGAVNWISRWYSPQGAATSDEIGATFADTLLQGLERRPRPLTGRPSQSRI
jgi:TetR/AcrR family transcriptional regulator